jgi:hypothetical protein
MSGTKLFFFIFPIITVWAALQFFFVIFVVTSPFFNGRMLVDEKEFISLWLLLIFSGASLYGFYSSIKTKFKVILPLLMILEMTTLLMAQVEVPIFR